MYAISLHMGFVATRKAAAIELSCSRFTTDLSSTEPTPVRLNFRTQPMLGFTAVCGQFM
jgi:hypothetical protein